MPTTAAGSYSENRPAAVQVDANQKPRKGRDGLYANLEACGFPKSFQVKTEILGAFEV